ncbi:MAG: bis-aminopropyl spermidine synthase family protein [Gammaproteobacteria bacterium]|nr:bis-aminopropyl spermidine synthase family protein [Gammaproteobacteria bacterium]
MFDNNLKQDLISNLDIYVQNRMSRASSIDDLINKLHTPRSLYELLSSKLTIREIIWSLAFLLENKQIEITTIENQPKFNFSNKDASNDTSPVSDGLHLIDTKSVRLNEQYLEVLSGLYKDKNLTFDQSIETYQSQIRRFKIMQSFGDLSHDSLLLLGDDAYFSLFLAFHGVKSKITVADIDEDVLGFIDQICTKFKFNNIETHLYNIFSPLPEKLSNRFDCFAVNGFKDLGGLLTFICRGVQSLLYPTRHKVGYFNYGNHEIEHTTQAKIDFDLQKFFIRAGLYMEQIVPCPESQVSPEFTQHAVELIVELANQTNALEKKWEDLDRGLLSTKQKFNHVSWVAMENFPDIQLSPLKIARCRILDLNRTEIDKYLRLASLYNKS